MSTVKKVSTTVKGLLISGKIKKAVARLGNLQGLIQDQANNVWVTLIDGEEMIVRNDRVPNVIQYVWVGRDEMKPDLLQVLGPLNSHQTSLLPDLPDHSHTWGQSSNPSWIRGEQFLPGLLIPAGGMIVQFYGLAYYLDGYHGLILQEIDLTAEIPSSGALFGLLEVDAAGVITVLQGGAVDTREMLEYEDIPTPSADKKPLGWAVKLYEDQTEIVESFDLIKRDLVDLRWSGYASGGLSDSVHWDDILDKPVYDPDRVVVTDAAGSVSTVPEYTFDLSTRQIVHGAASAPGGLNEPNYEHQVGDGESVGKFLWTYSDDPENSSFISLMRGAGSFAAPLHLEDAMVIGRIRARGYYDDVGGFTASQAEIRFTTTEEWDVSGHGTKIGMFVTPVNSTTMATTPDFEVISGSVNIPTGATYNINGSPHTHSDAASQEIVEDWIGAMVTGNTETGISVTYDDSTGKLNFDAQTAGDARYLSIANNLSDLANTGTARTNLGLVAGGAGDIWVEKAGDTMTGQLQLTPSSDIIPIVITQNTGNVTTRLLQIKNSVGTEKLYFYTRNAETQLAIGSTRKITFNADASSGANSFVAFANSVNQWELYSDGNEGGAFYFYNRTANIFPFALNGSSGLGLGGNITNLSTLAGAAVTIGNTTVGGMSIVGLSNITQLTVTGFTTQGGPVVAITRNDGATNTIGVTLSVNANSTGTPAAGFGVRQRFRLESSTTADAEAAAIDVSWATATHASRKASMALVVYDTAAREGIRIEASGTAPMLGFFGNAAVLQQTELTDELTTITFTAPGTSDYAIQDLTNAGGYGFVTKDEGNTVLSVIANLQTRVNELETALVAYGLLPDAD